MWVLLLLLRLLWRSTWMRQRPEHRAIPPNRTPAARDGGRTTSGNGGAATAGKAGTSPEPETCSPTPRSATADSKPTRSGGKVTDVAAQQITEALAELRGARLDHQHSPNADTELTVEYAELRLNRMLERYCGCGADGMPKPKAMT